MFDTHCHLNFKAFKKTLPDVIQQATEAGVIYIVIPGTDVLTSQKGVTIAQKYEHLYASVGIHPHHVYQYMALEQNNQQEPEQLYQDDIDAIEAVLKNTKVVAVGEIGMDRHVYPNTKYESYDVKKEFLDLQTILFKKQVDLAIQYTKSLIIHNREAKHDLLPLLTQHWDAQLEGHSVFHCCEPDEELLTFAKEHKMFIGVDGDITYREDKQEFIKQVPLEMLVLETDSPFLLPEPLRTEKKYPNGPQNIPLIAAFIASLKGMSVEKLGEQTTENAKRLFGI